MPVVQRPGRAKNTQYYENARNQLPSNLLGDPEVTANTYILQITQPSQYRNEKLQHRFAITSESPSTVPKRIGGG